MPASQPLRQPADNASLRGTSIAVNAAGPHGSTPSRDSPLKRPGTYPGGEALEGRDAIRDINVTPFVDVMLVLLVIFMVTTPALLPRMKMELPEATAAVANAAAEPEAQGEEPVLLEIDREGRLRFAGEPLARREDLAALLREAAQRRPQPELQLRADAALAYREITFLIGAAQEAGLRRIGLVTDQRPSEATASRTRP
ncbi:MAG: biopolymer transporter ExbD [Betaproteobacteria bacterium]|nr:biopolymer transporter ExbD [Betaproteobacteria bacterium]